MSISLISSNELKHLKILMPSLEESLTGIDHEILLADNGSSDGTVEYYLQQYPGVKICTNRNKRGYGANHNLNINRARGAYIMVLNADLKFEKNTVRDMVTFMERNPGCGVSSCRLMNWDGSGIQHNCRTFPTLVDIWARRFPFKNKSLHAIADRHEMLGHDYNHDFETDWFQGSFMFFRREALEQVGGFDERFFLYFDDVDICRRIHMTGWKVMYNSQVFAHHRFHRQSANPLNRLFRVHLNSMVSYFQKYGWKIWPQPETVRTTGTVEKTEPKVAIVHDYLTQYGGAERVLELLLKIYPRADLYTLVRQKGDGLLEDHLNLDLVKTSFVQSLPGSPWGQFREYLGFMPVAVESFDFTGYDMLISSSSAWAKGAITDPRTWHLCYLHSPMRFVWDWYHQTLKEYPWPLRFLLKNLLSNIRRWDVMSSQRPDLIVANSREVQKRISKYYRRDSLVLHPAVDTEFFVPQNDGGAGDYYLVVSRLKPYKRVDLAVQAFNLTGRPLVVVGDGSEMKRLKKMALSNVRFTGKVSDRQLLDYYQNCRALIFPTLEDFGLTPLEAQCCGKPVIAYGRGGALETVVDGKTGIFFDRQRVESLIEAVNRFEKAKFDRGLIREHAMSFNQENFIRNLKQIVDSEYEKFREGNP
ncbi:MAG: glycosyltransferase [Deltaproteobacteria bacterium]|nr:glycosyltransferase [Deltaproteobacteria bacterium]